MINNNVLLKNMKKALTFLLFLSLSCEFAHAAVPNVASSVDLNRYIGDWYEIAKFPYFFQRKCGAAKATYNLIGPSKIKVINVCKQKNNKNKLDRIIGSARVVDPKTDAKLKVSFFPMLGHFGEGDYWILYVDPLYQNAVVGTPDRQNLWFLSRSPNISPETYQRLRKVAADEGFDLKKLEKTPSWFD
jgi:apolipoprotein D and lipocalin family protein